MKKTLLSLCLGLAFAGTASAANINTAYQLRGDEQAMPVQAFDDGRQLYIQLRDPTNPPAPVGPNGPILYRIQGHYMVVPLTQSVTLQAGPHQARVLAAGAGDVAPGVVSMTRPVEALDTPTQSIAVMAPVVVSPSPAAVSALSASDTVRGEIEVAGSSGITTSSTALPTPQVPVPRPPTIPASRTVNHDEAAKASAFAGLRGRNVILKSDGSVAGARAAQKAASACRTAGAKCSIEYRGADAGTIQITEKL